MEKTPPTPTSETSSADLAAVNAKIQQLKEKLAEKEAEKFETIKIERASLQDDETVVALIKLPLDIDHLGDVCSPLVARAEARGRVAYIRNDGPPDWMLITERPDPFAPEPGDE